MVKRFLVWLGELWRDLMTSKYVKALEAEVERLRAENRALMNSIRGVAGIPPVITDAAGTGQSGAAADKSASDSRAKANAAAQAPIRRRSWQQVNRALEIEAAKKAVDSE
jgi:hypothetical protein